MMGMGLLLDALGSSLCRHRSGRVGRAVASRIERLYKRTFNLDNFDPHSNGEYGLFERMDLRQREGVIFDVGANAGDWAVRAARCFPRCSIHCFEPSPATCERLRQNIAANHLGGRVHVNALGLSDAAAELTFYEHADSTLCGSINWHPDRTVRETRCAVVRGDDYCRERSIEAIDFLKVDVEGTEFSVLKGFSSLIAKGGVSVIQFEYGAFAPQQRILVRDFYEFLGDGYEIGRILPSRVEFADYSGLMETATFSNYVAVRRDRPCLLR
jgi:FkbM family methyltransferase